MNVVSDSRQLKKIKVEMATLQEQFSRREFDVAYERTGGEIYYGIDNDVITAITAPWDEKNSTTFGPLFTDWPDSASAFATIFNEFLQKNRHHSPFLLIPPSQNELEGLWNDVFFCASESSSEVEEHFNNLLKYSESLKISPASGDAQVFDAVSRAVNIIYGGASPVTQLRRITRLSQSGAICRLDAYLKEGRLSPFNFPEKGEASNFLAKEKKWLRMLNSVRKERWYSNPNDAAVLAFIEFNNEIFAQKNERRRLCYVTGDSYIYRVAAQVPMSSGQSFSQEFLRRPTAFLADAKFFVGAGLPVPKLGVDREKKNLDSTVSVAEWLREVFAIHVDPKFGRPREGYSAQLMEAIQDVRLKWGDYLKSTSASLSISKEIIDSTIDLHIKAAKYLHNAEVADSINNLRKRMEVVTTEAKLGFGTAGALSRFWSIQPEEAECGLRGIPKVRFDTLGKANELASLLSSKNGLARTQIQLRREWLTTLHEEAKSDYTTMIIFSLAFASVSEWNTALNVAQLAYSIAQTQRELLSKTSIKGDEAAYLCAVFSRLGAKSISALSDCNDWLDQAETLRRTPPLRKELDVMSDRADDRFVAERLAVRLTRSLMEHFVTGADDSALSRALIEECYSFDILLGDHLTELQFLWNRGGYSIDDYHWQQLLINALQCLILADKGDRQGSGDILREYLEQFIGCNIKDFSIENFRSLSERINSQFILFVILSALLIVFSEEIPSPRREEFFSELHTLGQKQELFPYDEKRVSEFMHRSNQVIHKHSGKSKAG